MKALLLIFLPLIICINGRAQTGGVGIGTSVPHPGSILDLSSTSKAVMLPRLNTASMNAVSSPEGGLMVYNTDSSHFYGYTLTNSAAVISQTSQYWFPYGSATPYGQSFTAPAGLRLQDITVMPRSVVTDTASYSMVIKLRAGAGALSGTVLATDTVSHILSSTASLVTFTLHTDGMPLQAGAYTFTVEVLNWPSTNQWGLIVGANPYPGGVYYYNNSAVPSDDLVFTLTGKIGGWRRLD